MKTTIGIAFFKWRIVSLLIMCLSVFLPVVAQTDSTRWTVSQGQWRVLINLNAYDIAWSYLPNIKTTDVSSLGILNIGSGVEMAYRDNRTLRLMAHVGIIGNNHFSIAETFPPYPPTRIVWNSTISMVHMWYAKRWVLGVGPSFERRKVTFDVENGDSSPKYGTQDFHSIHYALGPLMTAGWRATSTTYFGIEYSPRIVVGSNFNYDDNTSAPTVSSSNGHFDHQLSFVVRMSINLTKH